MHHRPRPDDRALLDLLRHTRTIAMVGASPSPARDSHGVMRYLQHAGYRVIPVNPTAAGRSIHGEPVVARLGDIVGSFELVDVFRRADAVPALVEEILPLIDRHGIRGLWLQLGVVHDAAARRARAAGLEVVMDRCLKIEHRRLAPRSGSDLGTPSV